MENHTLATQGDLDQVRLAVVQLAENLSLIHHPAPDIATEFTNVSSGIIKNLTFQLYQPPSVQVHDLLAEMNDQTRDLAHQIPLEMLEANVAELRDQVNDLQSQVKDLQGQINDSKNQSQSAVRNYLEQHISRLNSLFIGLQSQLAINVTPSIDGFNRKIAHLQVQVDTADVEIAAINHRLTLQQDLAALETTMKAQQAVKKWLQTSQQTGAGQVEQAAGQASFPKGTPTIPVAVLHHDTTISPAASGANTPVSAPGDKITHNNTPVPSNRVNINISTPAPLGNHHNKPSTPPSITHSVHPAIAPPIVHGVHRATYTRGLNPEAQSFITRQPFHPPSFKQISTNITMSNTEDISGGQGAAKAAVSAPQTGEKTTIGDLPYDYHKAGQTTMKSGLEESMWAPANRRSPAPRAVSRAVPIVNPDARNEAKFVAEYNALVAKYEFTPSEGLSIAYKAVYGDVEQLSAK